jgi:catechol 2,3-dioxygenase-like lactoylglutathione lyase family enzyme
LHSVPGGSGAAAVFFKTAARGARTVVGMAPSLNVIGLVVADMAASLAF